MITEQQEEQASLYVLGVLGESEQAAFEAELRGHAELRTLVGNLQHTADLLAFSVPAVQPPTTLRDKVLGRIVAIASSGTAAPKPAPTAFAGLRFLAGHEAKEWKQLPVPGAYLKLLSYEPEHGYAVLLGKLDPGARYPEHINAGPEDFFCDHH